MPYHAKTKKPVLAAHARPMNVWGPYSPLGPKPGAKGRARGLAL